MLPARNGQYYHSQGLISFMFYVGITNCNIFILGIYIFFSHLSTNNSSTYKIFIKKKKILYLFICTGH